MKTFMIISMVGGTPDLGGLPCTGNVLCAKIPDASYGIYIVTGTPAQLTAVNALPQVIGLCTVSAPDFDNWPEMELTINPTVRTQLNTWLAAHGEPQIPANWIYRQVFAGLLRYYRNGNIDLLEHTLATAFRTAVNTMLTAHDLPTVPAGWTYYQLAQAIVDRLQGHWAELGDIIDPTVRTRINIWLNNHGYPNIPADWTYRQMILAICLRVNANYTIESTDVLE